jgi:PAS domain S-box-containing protein
LVNISRPVDPNFDLDMRDRRWPVGGGETGALIREYDWSRTSLGAKAGWPQSLRIALDMILASPVPMVMLWGGDGVMLYNDGYATFAGARHPRLLGSKVLEGWPEVADLNRRVLATGLRGETLSFRDEHLVLYRHGRPEDVWLDLDHSPIRDETGTPAGVLTIVVETTQRVLAERGHREAEQALRELNTVLAAEREAVKDANRRLVAETDFLHGLFQQAPSFMAVLRGPDHVFTLANASYLRLVGYREVIGKTVRDALPELASQGFFELLDNVYSSGEPFVGRESRLLLQVASGGPIEERFLDFIYQPITRADGTVAGIFVEGVDVTDRLMTSERLRVAQRAGGVGTFEWLPETGKMVVSEEYRRIWGLDPSGDVTNQQLVALIHPDDRNLAGPAQLVASDNPIGYAEYRIKRPDTGEERWIARRGEVLESAGISPRYVGVVFDITERKRIENALREADERMRFALRAGRLGFWEFDVASELLVASDICKENFGRAPEASFGYAELLAAIHPDDRSPQQSAVAAALASGADLDIEYRVVWPDATEHWLQIYGRPTVVAGRSRRLVGVSLDITQRKRSEAVLRELNETLEQRVTEEVAERTKAESALRQAQKMEAVGQLTGGIAHDFNNLLQGITGSLDLVLSRMAQGRMHDVERFITAAMNSANRAAALTHRLLAFSRRQPLNPKPVEANQLVISMEDLLRRTMGERIEIELRLDDRLSLTLCDPNQLESALLNLAINARDAMPDGGILTIETSNAMLDLAYAAANSEVQPGPYVCVAVGDCGTGMDPEVTARAFDPFFTTKPIGKGTGLGLSMIYGFARQSDGHVRIDSTVGQGTRVSLYLPRLSGDAASEEKAALSAEVGQAGGDYTVLVVEDDAIVRALIVEVLEELGYRVLAGADGPSGLDLLVAEQRIDLLVTDIGLPGLSGTEIADAARRDRPDLKVLFMTGYADDSSLVGRTLHRGMQIIAKPFSIEILRRRIHDLLNDDL